MDLTQDFLGKFEEGIPLLSNENTFGANPIKKNKDFEDGWAKRSFDTSSSNMSIHMASYLRAWGEMALLFLTCSIWDGWMASPTLRTWVWASSGSWWWTGEPGLLQSMGSQRVRHDWATELNWILKFEVVAGVLQQIKNCWLFMSRVRSGRRARNWRCIWCVRLWRMQQLLQELCEIIEQNCWTALQPAFPCISQVLVSVWEI